MALKANDVLIKSIDIGAKEWVAKEWKIEGQSFTIDAYNIWTDGENMYYSIGTRQHQLDKPTATWETKEWSGLTRFDGQHIWTDGEHIYYTYNSAQYFLNQALPTPTWQTKSFSGISDPDGFYVWSDGVNTYYSKDAAQYQLNKTAAKWEPKVWNGLTNFASYNIWSDGVNIYYSSSTTQYQLNKTTATWEPKVWNELADANGIISFLGDYIWHDNEGTAYLSYGEQQYELVSPIHYLYKGDTCQWVKPYTIAIKVTGTPNANIKVIIYRSSNAKGQEPSAVYDSSGGESSYVINVASTAADGQQIVGYYGDTLYVKAQSYSSGSDSYNISGQSYTVTGDGQITVNVSHSVTCSSCNTSARKNICNTRCNTNLKNIGVCGDTSKTSGMCMV